jgi:hypothetical protein
MAREAILTFRDRDPGRLQTRVPGRRLVGLIVGRPFGGIGAQLASGLGGHQGDPGAAAFDHPHPQVRPGRLI